MLQWEDCERRLISMRDFKTPWRQMGRNYLAKLELLHPMRSHKARAAIGMLLHSMREKGLDPHKHEIIEKTGGNLGYALAIVARMLGFRIAIAIGNSFPDSKKRLMQAVGATLLSGGTPAECIEREAGRVVEGRERFFIDQFSNPGVLEGFKASLGPQVAAGVADRPGHVRIVKGAGTGGSAAGIVDSLQRQGRSFTLHVVEPENTSFREDIYEDHELFGFSVGRRPPFLDLARMTSFVNCGVRDMEAARRRLLHEEGLFVGNTSAANDHCARQVAARFPDDVVVTVFYDRGEDYV